MEPTIDSEAHALNPNARREEEEALYDRFAQRLINALAQQLKKNFGIERVKALGATEFNGIENHEEAEKWIRTLEKCFRVMQCPKERRVNLAVFLLLERAEDWWILEENRRGIVS
ncbi:hypothetical protein Csa_006696 [Cucumis sativus]|uniref:Uncharacterized protein n=1 Tax=Cucumis sativus TaxID=3659 RepID=A0A0A0LI31_CUCSA|nr:hypothetical protein Csa_006696 [Cucumis sativus]